MSQKQTTELTVVERAALALGTSERETKLRELVANFATITEIKNAAARDQCHGALMTLRTTRTDITKAGKTARDDANAFSKAVINEEKRLVAIIEPEETRLQTLRDEWDEAREAEKRAAAEAEAKRIAAIREHIDDIRAIAVRVVALPAALIQTEIEDLESLAIDLPRFAELTGDAEAARGATLDKLRELHVAAVAHEEEQARLAAERADLERQRLELEAQRRRDEEARVERERVEREAREAREAADRAEREARERAEAEQRAREEAGRREQQAREDAERRAAIEAEERRLAAERAEMQRRQAELARAEAERHEREQAALREMEAQRERAEREQKEREQAANRAARLAPQPTGGAWSIGKHTGCIVTTDEIPGAPGSGHNDAEYYGGNLICESIWRPADAHILAAARDMFDALRQWQHAERVTDANELANACIARDAAIERATYAPTEEAVAA